MTTQYTPTLKLALPVTGELSGTWGDIVNDNITSMIEQAIAGLATINTWTGNAHTLTTADGTTSESRCAMLVAATGGGAPTAAAEIICPAAAKLYVLQNNTSYAVTLKTSAGTGVAVAAGNTAFLFCDGTNVNACVTTIIDGRVTGNLTVDGNATINGNTTLGNATSDTVTVTARVASNVLPSADNTYDLGASANAWKDVYIDGTAYLALVDINGGTIDGVSIGASTAATIINVDNLRLDGNTLSSTDSNGNVVIAPNGTGDVQLDADTVRVGDSGAAATLTSNGAGALTVTTGGAADLTLSTNSGTDSGTVVIANGANGNITLTPNGTGDVIVSADRTQFGDANTDTTLTTNGTGSLNLTTNNGTNSGTIQIAQGANGNITLTPNGTGSVSVPKFVVSTATSGRVPYTSTGGLIVDSANLTFDGTTLGSTALNITGNTTLGDASTDTVTVNGYMGVGGAASGGISVYARNTALTGTSQVGFQSQITATSASTTGVYGLYVVNSTEAAAFTVGNAYGVRVSNLSLGAGSSATNQHGLHIADLTSATNNYGITSLVSSGTNKWNIYASGTASNYFAGSVGIGTTSPTEKVQVIGDVLIGTDSGSAFNGNSDLKLQNTGNVYIQIKAGTTSDAGLLFGDTDDSFVGGMRYSNATDSLLFNTGNAERISVSATEFAFNDVGADTDFRVESDTSTHALFVDAGNSRVGINQSSPAYALDVSSAAETAIRVNSASGYDTVLRLAANGTNKWALFNEGATDDFVLYSNATTAERLRLTDTGNLGLGVTPSAWSSSWRAYSVAGGATLAGRSSNTEELYLSANVYNDGVGWKYIATNFATQYYQDAGTHVWRTAPSGTAGDAVTFAERLTVGTTEAVFNDPGNDYDFRVESDTNTHALFVDAGNSRVGINDSAPDAALSVNSASYSAPVQNINGLGTYVATFSKPASTAKTAVITTDTYFCGRITMMYIHTNGGTNNSAYFEGYLYYNSSSIELVTISSDNLTTTNAGTITLTTDAVAKTLTITFPAGNASGGTAMIRVESAQALANFTVT